MKLTERNIEEWDFRGVEPGSEADGFLSENYTLVVAVDMMRASRIEAMVDAGLGRLSEDGEYLVPYSDSEVWSNPDFIINRQNPGLKVPKSSPESDPKFDMFKGFTGSRLRDWLRSDTRFSSRVGRSLWREWKKYGRVKVRLLSNAEELEEYRRTIKDGAAVYRQWNVDDQDLSPSIDPKRPTMGASEETKEGGMGVLNGQLSAEAYGQAAMDLVEEAGAGRLPPIPQIAKERALFLVERVGDPRIVQNYADSLLEAFGVSYRFVTAETWEDLDREHARTLIDEGLALVRQQHLDTGVPDPLDVANPEHRVLYSLIGLTGTHPAFEHVRQYLFTRLAFQRLGTLDELHLRMGLVVGGVEARDSDAFMHAQTGTWVTGRALGILDVVGEIPE